MLEPSVSCFHLDLPPRGQPGAWSRVSLLGWLHGTRGFLEDDPPCLIGSFQNYRQGICTPPQSLSLDSGKEKRCQQSLSLTPSHAPFSPLAYWVANIFQAPAPLTRAARAAVGTQEANQNPCHKDRWWILLGTGDLTYFHIWFQC